MAEKFSFQQYQAQYPDDDACLAAIFERRYGKADACPKCGIVGKLTKIEGRRAYACKEGCHTYPCAGTIFEHSSTPLKLWFHAMYLMTATRNGVSAKEIERQLGVTYKCAWRIGHQLRLLMADRAMAQAPEQLSGHVEMDETYVGGKLRKFHGFGKGHYLKNKATVFGIVERKGAIRARVVPNEQLETLWPIIRDNVEIGSTVSTDTHRSYRRIKVMGFNHGRINHDKNEWKRGIHHTNTIEGFWAHLKKGLKSTHVSVSKGHLQKYVDEFAFRFNNREAPAEMFQRLVRQVSRVQ